MERKYYSIKCKLHPGGRWEKVRKGVKCKELAEALISNKTYKCPGKIFFRGGHTCMIDLKMDFLRL